jgi:hypothetical protein
MFSSLQFPLMLRIKYTANRYTRLEMAQEEREDRALGFAYCRGLFHSTVIIKQNLQLNLKGIKLVNASGRKRKAFRDEDDGFAKKKIDVKVYFSKQYEERRNTEPEQEENIVDEVILFDRRRNTVNAYESNDLRADIRVESYIALRERKAKKELERKELQDKIRTEFDKKMKGMSHEQILRELCPEAADALKKNNPSKLRKLLTRKLAEYHPDKHIKASLETMLKIEEKYKLLLSLRDHYSD